MSSDHDAHATAAKWVFLGFALIAGFLLFTEHRAHVLGFLPYLFLLACPLLHLFMHHGHHDHSKGGPASPPDGEEK